jgi:hypothetical protein
MDLAVSRPHDVFEQLRLQAISICLRIFSPPGSESRAFNFCGFGASDQEFNMPIDTGHS